MPSGIKSNYAKSTDAESALVGFAQNVRFAVNNIEERVKLAVQRGGRPSTSEIAVLANAEAFVAAKNVPGSDILLAEQGLSNYLDNELKFGPAESKEMAENALIAIHGKLAGFVIDNKDEVHKKLCSIMDFSTTRSINNAVVDRLNLDRRHTFDHGNQLSSRVDIIKSVMDETHLCRVVAQECNALTAHLKATIRASTDKNQVEAGLTNWVDNKLLIKSAAIADRVGHAAREMALAKGTQTMALKLTDAFMAPRPEVVQAHSAIFHEVLSKYQQTISRILNDGNDPEHDLNLKPSLVKARKDAWGEIEKRCGSYLGLDSQQSRMMKHMGQQYSDLNYGTGRWAATGNSTLGLATIATQLMKEAFVKAANINPISGHVVKAFSTFATTGLSATATGAAAQMLAGDVVTNAKMLRRYNDASSAPPQYSSLFKSTTFKENREIIKVCEELLRSMKDQEAKGDFTPGNRLGQQTAEYFKDVTKAFPTPEDAAAFLNKNFHLHGVLKEACRALNAQGDKSPAVICSTNILRSGEVGETSNEDIFAQLAMLNVEANNVSEHPHPDILASLAHEFIDKINSAPIKNKLIAALAPPPPAQRPRTLKDDVCTNPSYVAKVIVSDVLKEIKDIKSSKIGAFLKDTAADSSLRSVVRGAIVNSVVPAVGSTITAIPGIIAGSLMLPGPGTTAIGAVSGLVGNHVLGKVGALVAGEVVVKADAKAAVDGKISALIHPGEAVVSREAIMAEINTTRKAELQKQHDSQIDTVVLARVDDLADNISKNRLQIGRLCVESIFNCLLKGDKKFTALTEFVQLEKDIAAIATHRRTVQKAAAFEPRVDEATRNVNHLSKLQGYLLPEEQFQEVHTNDTFATNSIRKGKESKTEHFQTKLNDAKGGLDALTTDVADRGAKLVGQLADLLLEMPSPKGMLSRNDLLNLFAPFVYPVGALRQDDIDRVTQRLSILVSTGPAPAHADSLLSRLSSGDLGAQHKLQDVVKSIRGYESSIRSAENDIGRLAQDHMNYRTDNFDLVRDKFNIYHRANVNYDSAQMQARSYSEVSGAGLARVGARLAVGITVGLTTSAIGAAVSGVSSAATGMYKSGLSGMTDKEMTTVAAAQATGLKAGIAEISQVAKFINPTQAPFAAATRGNRVAERPAVKPDDVKDDEVPYTFRTLGLDGIANSSEPEAINFLQDMLKGKGTHKISSFERKGTIDHPKDRPIIGSMLGLSSHDEAEAAQYKALQTAAAAGEGRGAAKRAGADILKSIGSSFNTSKFAVKSLAPSDARAVASLNKLEGELIKAVVKASKT